MYIIWFYLAWKKEQQGEDEEDLKNQICLMINANVFVVLYFVGLEGLVWLKFGPINMNLIDAYFGWLLGTQYLDV